MMFAGRRSERVDPYDRPLHAARWLNFGLLRPTSFLWSKAKGSSRYSALERRLEQSQGPWIAGRLIKPLGTYKILLIALAALCICAALTRLAGYIITKRGGEIEKKKDQEILSSEGGFNFWCAIAT